MSTLTLFADRLCQTLLHSLWQATVIFLLVAMAVRLSRCGARTGYATWMSGLVVAVCCMPITFLTISPGLAEQQAPASVMSLSTKGDRSSNVSAETKSSTPAIAVMQPDTDVAATHSVDSPAVASSVKENSDEQPVEAAAASTSLIKSTAPWIVAVYAIGVVMMLVRLCFSAANANRLVRTATIQKDDRLNQIVQLISQQWNMRIAPVVAVTQQVVVPHVVGLFRPVILLPASAMTGLSTDELSLVLAHEIAHLRRFDLWAAMVQRFAEAVLFFNPAVWLLSRRVSEFREFCCDDLVCQNAAASQKEIGIRYAQALLQVVSLSAADHRNTPGLTALAASGRAPSELRRRIARLLNEPLSEPFPAGRSLLILFGACLLWLTLPVFLPTNLSNGPNSSASMADDQGDDKTTQREFRLQINGPDAKPLSNVQCEIRGISKITAADVLVGRHEKDARYGIKLVTNEKGQLHFQRPANVDYLDVFVEVPGYGPYLAEWRTADGSDGIPDSFTMELESAWTVTGQVVDESGKPIVGANVSPSVQFRKRPGDERKMGVGTDLTTDANGFWRYEMVPSSKDYVHVSIDSPNYAPSRLSLKRAEYEAKPDVAPKTIALTKGLSVTGTVTDENGKPIEEALVRTKYANEIREAKTDKDGKYTLTGCESKLCRIVCSADGRAREMHEVLIDPEMAPVNFTMPPGRHIRIRVLDENGKGVARSRIYFQSWRGHIDYFEFNGVNQYTDDEGVWEWNEAPVDEFEADICRADGMQLQSQPIKAREEEYVFRPPRLLVISGRVTDKATGELVKRFRCIPGGRNEPEQRLGENWHLRETHTSTDGTYKVTRDSDAPAHMVRIEADGYKVAVSRDIQSDEGDVQIDFELTQAPDIAIALKTPDDQPASNAQVAIGLANEQISIKNGEFTSSTYARRLNADKAGILKMPFRDQPFEIYVLHPTGFAQVSSVDGTIPDKLILTAWASVAGTIFSANKPAATVPVRLYSDGFFQSELCRLHSSCEVPASPNGTFAMPKVFPGTGRIGRDIVYMVNDGATEVTSSQRLTVSVSAGEAKTIEIGRGGRPVTGKLMLPPDFQQAIVWGQLRLELGSDVPQPFPVGLDMDDPQAVAKWQQTKEARDYEVAVAAWQAQMAKLPEFSASVDREGNFRIDNVPAGKFVLSEWLALREWKLSLTPRSFEVPEIDGDYEETPLDLGEIHLTPQ
jgi:beta-lactamase regulating signal transducer with metallopeptidase domain/uncharacterized GH25 family protein